MVREATPVLSTVLEKAIEKRLCDLFTAMPGEVVTYDVNTGLATIKPLMKRKYLAETESIDLPLITNVPVCFTRVGKSRLRFPVNAGDEGQIQWQMRSIDIWLKTGGTVDPVDPRKFNISDATFWPGLTSQKNTLKLKGAATSTVLENDKGFIEITPDGKFKVTNGVQELFDILDRWTDELILALGTLNTDTVNTIFGPMPLNNFPVYGTAKIRMQALKTELGKLKKG